MLNAYCTFRLFLKVSLHSGRLYFTAVKIAGFQLAFWLAFLCVAAALNRRRRIKFSSWLQPIKLSLGASSWITPAARLIEAVATLSYTSFTHEVREGYPLNLSI